jgi:ribosome-associated toxin RatA of RatAB toxin-antitoxin module
MTTDTVRSEIEISASPDQVMDTLLDMESYPEWAKGVRSARILDTDDVGRPLTVEFEVTPGPLPKMRYVLRYAYEPMRLSWDYVEGDMRDLHGSYTLDPDDGRTSVTYELAIDPGSIPLPGFVKARAAREITKVALKELKRRVELASQSSEA